MSSKLDSTGQAWLRLAAVGIAQSILRIRQSPCVRRAPGMPNQETICWRLIGAVSLGIRLVLLCFSSFLVGVSATGRFWPNGSCGLQIQTCVS